MRRPGPLACTLAALVALSACALCEPADEPFGGLGRAAAAERGWQRTIDRVAPAVVMLRVSSPRSFDHQRAGTQTATGFVVDAERGLILTNRHVVTAGPVVADAVFLDNEEVDVRAIYRDPVHDFGFFQFDPADVKFMDVVDLDLEPDRARVGTQIRVIGNDAGEKLSILAGTLARIDRDAPPYGRATYNDFNTFYLQAASSTSGGSSGSPVIDISGAVIALNAGANRTSASSFFLPLDRVVRALECIRAGRPVSRGTLQTTFLHRPYDEIRRLGLRGETEAELRESFPDGTGLLVVSQVVPGGPADGRLEVGDVLVAIEGRRLNHFTPLEDVLDAGVGRPVELEVERGGRRLEVEVVPQDLHAITPASYVEVSGGIFNTLSYHLARGFNLPARGVYVADPGYMLRRAGVPRGAVITDVAGRDVRDLATFERVVAAIPDRARIPVRYFSVVNPRTTQVAVVEVDRNWFPMVRCERSADGAWPCTPSPASAGRARPRGGETELVSRLNPAAAALAPSLVAVDFQIPFPTDGVHALQFRGTGLVVDAERGWVVVDRETVPVAMGDIAITFSASVRVPGELVYLHPEHNLAIVRYDPTLLGETNVRTAVLRPGAARRGAPVWLVCLSGRGELVSLETSISRIDPLQLPLLRVPRFREANLDALSLADVIPSMGGVIADRDGRVMALWSSFSSGTGDNLKTLARGLPIERLVEVLEPLRAGSDVVWRSLGAEWQGVPLAEARDRGVPEDVARLLERSNEQTRRVLEVVRTAAGSPAARSLKTGDLLVSIGGQPMPRVADVERVAQRGRVVLDVVRAGKRLRVPVDPEPLDGSGTDRLVVWAGAVLQAPHRPLAIQRGLAPEGVYVSFYFYGSPAGRYGLRATQRIVGADGRPTPDLDAFLKGVAGKRTRDSVRLKTLDLDGKEEVITIKLDLDYFPTYALSRGPTGWVRADVPGPSVAAERAARESSAD